MIHTATDTGKTEGEKNDKKIHNLFKDGDVFGKDTYTGLKAKRLTERTFIKRNKTRISDIAKKNIQHEKNIDDYNGFLDILPADPEDKS